MICNPQGHETHSRSRKTRSCDRELDSTSKNFMGETQRGVGERYMFLSSILLTFLKIEVVSIFF